MSGLSLATKGIITEALSAPSPPPGPTPPDPIPSPISLQSPQFVDHVGDGIRRLVLQFRKPKGGGSFTSTPIVMGVPYVAPVPANTVAIPKPVVFIGPRAPDPIPSPLPPQSAAYVDHLEEGLGRLVLQFRKPKA